MARPISTSYTDEERDEIIAHVLVQVASGRFVSRVLAEDKTTGNGIEMPAHSTFWLWVFQDDSNELSDKLARAREHGIEALLDECGEIADDGTNDWEERERKDGSTYVALNTEAVMRSKLRVETRIKMAQMMKPKTYGPKLDLTSGGDKLGLSAAMIEAERRLKDGG